MLLSSLGVCEHSGTVCCLFLISLVDLGELNVSKHVMVVN